MTPFNLKKYLSVGIHSNYILINKIFKYSGTHIIVFTLLYRLSHYFPITDLQASLIL